MRTALIFCTEPFLHRAPPADPVRNAAYTLR